jgi:hypothetical protein
MWQHIKTIKIFKNVRTVIKPSWLIRLIILLKFLNILIVFNISNINKEINKKTPGR